MGNILERAWRFTSATAADAARIVWLYFLTAAQDLFRRFLRATQLEPADPEQQIFDSIILIILAIGSSVATGGILAVTIVLFAFTMVWGIFRLGYQGGRYVLLDEGSPD